MTATPAAPSAVYLKDYVPPEWLIDSVRLDIDIRSDGTVVTSTMDCRRNPAVVGGSDLRLDGEDLETLSVAIDGKRVQAPDCIASDDALVIHAPPARFQLETQVRIRPDQNTQLS